MQVIFKELTKSFEETLLYSLIKNEKKEEFEKIRQNLINQSDIDLSKFYTKILRASNEKK